MKWIVLDWETSGLNMPSAADLSTQPHGIELGCAAIMTAGVGGGAPECTERKSWLINPGIEITEEITKITGISNEDLKGKPTFAQILPEVLSFFSGAEGLVAHNLPFDLTILVNELRRLGKEFAFPYPAEQLCTVQAFHYLKGRNLKLTELYEHVMRKPLDQKHRAMSDVDALVEILIKEEILQ